MHIECVGCSARYDVPDEAVRPGRVMRCVRCGETWVPRAAETAPAPVPAMDAPLVPVPDAPLVPVPDALLASAPVAHGGAALAGAWLLTVVVLAVAAVAVWHFRGWIGHVWPPARRLTG